MNRFDLTGLRSFLVFGSLFFMVLATDRADGHDHKTVDKKRQLKSHQHGTGKMNLVAEGNKVLGGLEVPAHDVVGFEQAPKDKKQKKRLDDALTLLRDPSKNLKFDLAGGCKPTGSGKVETSLNHQGGHSDHKHNHEESEGLDHSEFRVEYSFQCSSIKNIKFVEALLFKNFPRLQKLKAQVLFFDQPVSEVLTADSAKLKIR